MEACARSSVSIERKRAWRYRGGIRGIWRDIGEIQPGEHREEARLVRVKARVEVGVGVRVLVRVRVGVGVGIRAGVGVRIRVRVRVRAWRGSAPRAGPWRRARAPGQG